MTGTDTAPAAATWSIRIDGQQTTALWEPAPHAPLNRVFVMAHGAGGHMNDRAMLATSEALRARGVSIVRFNFYYRAAGSSRPDPMTRLLECLEAVVARVRAELAPEVLVLGGRSMGGRAASMAAAQGMPCEGVLLLAYPLHPPAQPAKLRASHLAAIPVPVLCINGTRDTFCDRALMTQVLTGVGATWRMHWVADADHGFHVLKRSGRTDTEVMTEVADLSVEWLAHLGR